MIKNYWLLILIGIMLFAGSWAFIAGYRLDQGGITRVGTLALSGLGEHATVYIDQARRVSVSKSSLELSLIPGTHSIIVDTPGNQPWNEIFTIAQNETTAIAPLLVPSTVKKTVLSGTDAAGAVALIRATTLPSKASPLMLGGGCARVYYASTHILAEAATTSPSCAAAFPYLTCPGVSSENPEGICAPTILFSPNTYPHAVIAYPGREDALIVSAGSLVYVLEMDPRTPQFFAPLFKGAHTGIAAYSPTSIVVNEGAAVAQLDLGS